tara:strand:+ start:3840 stop:5141 length:1302 start_codon:yes stop_codon:yes gene_type:complete
MLTKNENISYLKSCKICGNHKLKKVIKLNEQYISATFVKSNKENNLKKIKSTLNLLLCIQDGNLSNCGHLQLQEIINPNLLYKNYFYRSATSDTMRKDLQNVVESVLKIVKPDPQDIVVDIGSNDCTLLNYYKKDLKLIGFEPAKNIKFIDKGKNIKIFNDYFNAQNFNKDFAKKAKIITSCAMFYDLENPKKFVSDIRDILAEDGVWCVQVSYLLLMIKNLNFYDICHEHLSYYSIHTFDKLVKQFNLKIFYAETNSVNGGSIRFYVCKNNCNKYDKNKFQVKLKKLLEEEEKYKLNDEETFLNFQKKIDELKYKTNTYINSILSEKKIVLALGASTKGNILLQHFGLGKDKIPFISERNSTKVGLRCLGTDIELISEEKARSLEPKAMLVLPWYFKEEIVKREKKYIDNGGQLMFPMPYPHVVTKKAEIKL